MLWKIQGFIHSFTRSFKHIVYMYPAQKAQFLVLKLSAERYKPFLMELELPGEKKHNNMV